MARMPRSIQPGVPLHVVQRGNDRREIFRNEEDLAFFRSCAGYAARQNRISVHAYVLMTNHFHLLATPDETTGLARMMQAIGRVYVKYFNQRYGRVGGLWQGRYRAAMVGDTSYFFSCMRYIELNPVRAGMVAGPADYRWSSFHANAYGHADGLVAPHALYRELGTAPPACRDAYRAMFGTTLSPDEVERIRYATHRGQTLLKI